MVVATRRVSPETHPRFCWDLGRLCFEAGDGARLCLATSQSNVAISLVRWTDLGMFLLSRAHPYIPLDLELSLLALTSAFVLVLCLLLLGCSVLGPGKRELDLQQTGNAIMQCGRVNLLGKL